MSLGVKRGENKKKEQKEEGKHKVNEEKRGANAEEAGRR